MKEENLMEKIISLCKRRGFIYQGSEIYGGLAGTWDYGPMGVLLKNNLKNLWWRRFVLDRTDMYGMDASILMNQEVWKASGHVEGFTDPMIECPKCNARYRRDHLPYDINYDGEMLCTKCKGVLGEAKQFNMMFKTSVGAVDDSASVSYLRPETAQGIFVNFKNVVDSFHPKLPFGIGQIGKAFRNEITPRDFVFRVREFEQMEVEYFVKSSDWERAFKMWQNVMNEWISEVGIDSKKTHEVEVSDEDRAHYSKRTIDFEFEYPFGQKELYGLAYRTDYDLKNHKISFSDDNDGEIIPHVIEPSLGVDRTLLALLVSAYTEDEMGDEKRVFLKIKPYLAPIKVAVFPLLKNKENLVKEAEDIFTALKKEIPDISFDDNGNIGKRYRRQDEIGTPFCVTIDFDTLEDGTVTLRDRDTGKQERIHKDKLLDLIKEKVSI